MENSAGPAQPGVAAAAQGSAATDKVAAPKSVTAFRTISEVSELLETPAHVLRFWESRFPQVRPVKRAGGRRYYRPADVALLAGIRKLLHDDGLAIRGVQKMLRDHGVKSVTAPAEPAGETADAGEWADAAAPAETVSGAEDHGTAPPDDMTAAYEQDEAASPAEAATPPRVALAENHQPAAADDAAKPAVEPPLPPELTSEVLEPEDAGALAHVPTEAPTPPAAMPHEAFAPEPEEAAQQAPTEAQPAEDPAPAPDIPDEPPRPRVLMRRRTAGDPPGLFSLMDAPEHPRPAPPEPAPDMAPPSDEPPVERPLAALLRAADPARLAPHADALGALHARLEAIRARRDCAGRGR